MLQSIIIDKKYISFDINDNTIAYDNPIFSKSIDEIETFNNEQLSNEEIYNSVIETLQIKTNNDNIVKSINDEYKMKCKITPLSETITLENDMIIELTNCINKKYVVDLIGLLSTIYEKVYLCTTIYNDIRTNTHYIVCNKKISKVVTTIHIGVNRFATNINNNITTIFNYIYCYCYRIKHAIINLSN